MAEENIRCPKCGSNDVNRHWGDRLLKGGASLIGGMIEGYFGGSGSTGGEIAEDIADEIFQNYVCKKCGHNFSKEDTNKKTSNSRSSLSIIESYPRNSQNNGMLVSTYNQLPRKIYNKEENKKDILNTLLEILSNELEINKQDVNLDKPIKYHFRICFILNTF